MKKSSSKTIISIIIITLINYNIANCQKHKFSGFIGTNYGGPIPTKTIENSTGKPDFGILFGLSFTYIINSKLALNTDFLYSNKKVNYATNYRKDTLIPQQINNTTYYLNSFYKAYINGEMNLHYIENHYSISYKILKNTDLSIGFYISKLIGGFDKGEVQVIIGEGGFLGDYFENFDNINNINQFDFGFNIGIKTYWYKKFYSEFRMNRSIKTLYSNDIFSNRGLQKNKMYHTYAFFLIGIAF